MSSTSSRRLDVGSKSKAVAVASWSIARARSQMSQCISMSRDLNPPRSRKPRNSVRIYSLMCALTSSTSRPTRRHREWSRTRMDMVLMRNATPTVDMDGTGAAITATHTTAIATTLPTRQHRLLQHLERSLLRPTTRPNTPSIMRINPAVIPMLPMVVIRTMLLITSTTSNRPLQLNSKHRLHLHQGIQIRLHHRLIPRHHLLRHRRAIQPFRPLRDCEHDWSCKKLTMSERQLRI